MESWRGQIFFCMMLFFGALSAQARLMVSEMMTDSYLSDARGEYFELYNSGLIDIDINGWHFEGYPTGFTVNNSGSLIVPALGFIALGVESNQAINGGVVLDYEYSRSQLVLANGAGHFEIFNADDELVIVVDYDVALGWPKAAWSSMYLKDPTLSPKVGANWGTSTGHVNIAIGEGSPGYANDEGVWGAPIAATAPICVTAENPFVYLHESISLEIVGTDYANGDDLSLSALSLPAGTSFVTVTGNTEVVSSFIWTDPKPSGVYTAQFVAADVDGSSVLNVIVTVEEFPLIWINEFHYDNTGTDVDEGFEIAGLPGTDLSNYTVYSYEGDNGLIQGVYPLSGVLPEQGCGIGTLWFDAPGLENSTEGLALYNMVDDVVLHALAYEDGFVGVDPPAEGRKFDYIGLNGSPDEVDYSHQLSGAGSNLVNFVWGVPEPHSRGNINSGQSLVPCSPSRINRDGDGCTDSTEIVILGTDPDDPCDCPQIFNVDFSGLGDMLFQAHSVTSQTIRVEETSTPSLINSWTNATSKAPVARQPIQSFRINSTQSPNLERKYYRVRYSDEL